MAELPKLYRELAVWWPLLSPPEEYAEEAAFYGELLRAPDVPRPGYTLLELGSGGGNNAVHLKRHFEMCLVDLSPEMLEVSRRLNPECEHHQGDMRDLRLGRQFDRVFIHDAIAYMTSERDLRRAIETAFVHCAPGGAALFAPDHVRENFQPATDHGGTDGAERGLRYLEWAWDPDPTDTTYVVDYAYLLREPDGSTSVVYDRHVDGLFPRADWLRWLEQAGFVPATHSSMATGEREVFFALKPE
jgi:SAM-dependent methyltransferase